MRGLYDGGEGEKKKGEINCLFEGSAEPFCCGGDLSFISSLKSLQRLERQRTCQQTSVYKAEERGGGGWRGGRREKRGDSEGGDGVQRFIERGKVRGPEWQKGLGRKCVRGGEGGLRA